MKEKTINQIYQNNCLILFILIYLKIIDVFSTLLLIHRYSVKETNPLFSSMVYNPYTFIFTQVLMLSFSFFALSYVNYHSIKQKDKGWLKIENKLLKITMYFYIFVVSNNLTLLIRYVI